MKLGQSWARKAKWNSEDSIGAGRIYMAAMVRRPAAGVAPFPGTGVGASLSGLASRLCDALLTAARMLCALHAIDPDLSPWLAPRSDSITASSAGGSVL